MTILVLLASLSMTSPPVCVAADGTEGGCITRHQASLATQCQKVELPTALENLTLCEGTSKFQLAAERKRTAEQRDRAERAEAMLAMVLATQQTCSCPFSESGWLWGPIGVGVGFAAGAGTCKL